MEKELKSKIDYALQIYFKEPKKCSKLARQIIKEGKAIKDEEAIAYGHYLMGVSLFGVGEKRNMLKHALYATAYFKTSDNYDLMSKSYNLLGIAYSSIEEYQYALSCYLEALRIAESKCKSRSLKKVLHNNIGTAYYSLGDGKQAARYINKIYQQIVKSKNPDQVLLNTVCYNLSDIYQKMGDLERSLSFANVCKGIIEDVNNPIDKLIYYCRRTVLHFAMGENEAAIRTAKMINDCIRRGEVSYEILGDLEEISLKLIEIEEYDIADVMADYLADYAEETNFAPDLIRACRVQAAYFCKMNDYKRAIYYYKKMDNLTEEHKKYLLNSQLIVIQNNNMLQKKMEEFKLKMQYKELESQRDSLTGLLNRRMMSVIINRYAQECQKDGTSMGCLFMDIDYFKEYNDTYGHVDGDRVLQKISKVLLDMESEREHLHFVRYGGDEFFAIMRGYADKEVQLIAKEVVERIHNLHIEHKHQHTTGQVAVSVGVMNIKLEDDFTILDVIRSVDKALYHSKDMGRDCAYMIKNQNHNSNQDIEFEKIV